MDKYYAGMYLDRIEIRRVDYGDGRRGLFAKKSLKAHETFLVCNAMAVVKKTDDLSADTDRLVQLIQQVATSEHCLAQLHTLTTTGKGEMEIPPVALFNPNCKWTPPAAGNLAIDGDDLKEIVKLNSCSSDQETALPVANNQPWGGEDKPATIGLWILPAFINHSCVPNCIHMSIGKIKLVSIMRDIQPGEELTVSYLGNLFTIFGDRMQKLLFTCNCERCSIEKRLDVELSQIHAQVRVLLPASRKKFESGNGVFRKDKVQVGSNSNYSVTRELAGLADQVEVLLRAVDMQTGQDWFRAGFLAAYLAKYQLAIMQNTDVSIKIDTLNLMVSSMISIHAADCTLTIVHLLFFEILGRYKRNSTEYKKMKELVFRVLRSLFVEDTGAQVWSDLHSNELTSWTMDGGSVFLTR